RENNARKITAVEVVIGALAGISPDHPKEHFDEAARGTSAEGAAVRVKTSQDELAADAIAIRLQAVEVATCRHAGGPLPHLEAVGQFYSRAELVEQRARWKQEGKTVVFTNGCYDLLHPGHIRLLEQARSLGDILLLALNSDASVQRLKGPSRPLISQAERAALA